MILHGSYSAKSPCRIDFIEFMDGKGNVVTADWDESEWAFDEGEGSFLCKGVAFNEQYANGRLAELLSVEKISHVQVYAEEDVSFALTDLSAVDGDDSMMRLSHLPVSEISYAD